ncbi:LysM peptidoglycan-binding domain-containing protein [Microbacterium oleivorans]|uniref:LysM peptidoglycan-binding domain-containing protein n=1 Tax=Microbacterium oleivorans TaxID=273677 RepID=A0A7D5EXD3_9MICO|nr:LysM peptidoglycan-binding domain-containing protein [Microbacterium oleivorans]
MALSLGAQPAVAAEPATRENPPHDAARSIGRGGVSPVTAAPRPAEHVVAPGDTISRIAARHGLRTVDVLAWNGLDWSSVIRPGDVVRLNATVAAAPTAAPAVSQPATPAAPHTVAAGDTPWSIAAAAGTSVDALLAANGLQRDAVIFPGQVLALPGSAPAAAPGAVELAAPVDLPAAAEGHTVVTGDTLSGIAAAHGLGLDALLSANGLDRASIIYPGQTLVVPGAAAAPAVATASSPDLGLDAEQIANARLIIQVGRDRGVPDRGIAIALATAMVESWIRNLDWGDRDSLGLFQQRPSTGWGTPDQVRDPARSIATFYGGPADPNGIGTRGLLDVAGWESLAFTDAAQAVQVSAYPDRYGEWEQQAYLWLDALG